MRPEVVIGFQSMECGACGARGVAAPGPATQGPEPGAGLVTVQSTTMEGSTALEASPWRRNSAANRNARCTEAGTPGYRN